MAKDLEEALVKPETKLRGAEKPHMDLGAHLEYIESLLERGGGSGSGSGGGSVDLLKPILTEGKAPVPNTGYVEKIFFNTKLTTDEVDSIIANANLTFINDGNMPLYPILGSGIESEAGSEAGVLFVIIDFSSITGEAGSSWAIGDMFSNNMFYVSSSVAPLFSTQDGQEVQEGWNAPSFTSFDTGEVVVNRDLVDITQGINLGTANNLLTNLIYLPESVDSGETEVAKSLTGQYKIVETTLKLDTKVSDTYTYDFIDSINENTKEISVIKNIKINTQEKDIIEKSLTTYTNNEVKKIGNSAFSYCDQLTNAIFSNAVEIGDYAFSHCDLLTNIDIPRVKVIHDWSFGFCRSLESINLPEATDIRYSAFYECNLLRSITAPKVEIINQSAFYNCDLKKVEFPKAVQIKMDAFSKNFLLTEAILPQLALIDQTAFNSCYSLVKVFIARKDRICELDQFGFTSCPHIEGYVEQTYNPQGLKDGRIYVPASLLSQYKVAENWINYASQIIGHEDLEAGAALPNYTTSSFTTQTWYSDEKLTTVVTSVTTTGRYYCRLEA